MPDRVAGRTDTQMPMSQPPISPGHPSLAGARDDPAVDAWLADKARAGDTQALEILVHRHRTRVYRVALRILGDRQDAEEVTQDVFVQLTAALSGFLGTASFTTWLYRIVVNRSLNHRRRHRDTVPLDRADGPTGGAVPTGLTTASAEDVVIARQRAQATARAIASLPEDQRSVFVLHQMEGLSYKEVATILTLSEATVRGRLARARRNLLDQLREWA